MALAALAEGDLRTAERVARRLLNKKPNDPAVHQLAAVVALRQGETERAVRWAAASLARRPDHVATLLIAGRAASAAKDAAGAAAFFRRASALAPDRADAAFLTCIALLELGDPEAGTLLTGLLDQFPDDAEGWSLLGAALQHADQPEAALVAFARAIRAMPSPALHMRRGMLLEALGRLGEAAEAYRAAEDHATGSGDAALKLGLCLRRTGDTEGASAALERAVVLAPNSGEAWFALGLVRHDKRDLESAADAYHRALELRPDLAEAAVNLGICRQETGDLTAAKAAYHLALRLRPDTFGRIAQALAAAPTGEVWLDLAALRDSLVG
ncbi:MAG: tetratricopeptide repeat protein [Xanthobacteraceae bacterium]